MTTANQKKVRQNFNKVIGLKNAQSYVSKFEAAVRNIEMLDEEERYLKHKAVQMRFASYF